VAGGLIAGVISGLVGAALAFVAAMGLVNVANNQATSSTNSDQPLVYYGSN
jgi:hypothetical protein